MTTLPSPSPTRSPRRRTTRRATALLTAFLVTLLLALPGASAAASGPPPASASARSAPAPAPLTTQDANAWLDGLVPGLIDAHEQAGGVVVAIVQGGRVVTTRGYGAADADRLARGARPLDAQKHLVRIGSVSKTFTATAVMQLVEAGRLDLDADVRTYLDFPLRLPRGPVTLRHLLSHTAGFEDRYAHLDATTASAMRSLRDTVALDPPEQIYAPGTTPAYSNYSNDLAGYVVQRVSGVPYEEYVQARILRPLRMMSTTLAQPVPPALAPRMAAGFPGRGAPAGGFEYINSRPAGSVTASAIDMAQYLNALLGHGGQEAITPTVRRALLDARPLPGLESLAPAGYVSLAFHHSRVGDHEVVGHGGDTGLFHSQLSIVPDADAGIFVSATGGAKADVRGEIERAFLRRYVAPAPRAWPDRPAGGQERAAAIAGTWTIARRADSTFAGVLSQTFRIVPADAGDLRAVDETWREVSPWVWENEDGTGRIAAKRSANGAVEAVSPVGYFTATRGGLLDTMQQFVALGAALAVLLVAAVTSLVVGLRRRGARRRRADASAVTALAPARSRLRAAVGAVAPWAPVAILLGVGALGVLLWPLLTNPMSQPLWIPALRIAQVLLLLGGLSTLVVLGHAGLRLRDRRWGPALGWLLVGAACAVVLTVAASGGVFLPDATY